MYFPRINFSHFRYDFIPPLAPKQTFLKNIWTSFFKKLQIPPFPHFCFSVTLMGTFAYNMEQADDQKLQYKSNAAIDERTQHLLNSLVCDGHKPV